MGTRSLVHVKNSEGQTLVTIYHQLDGYPTGIGKDILKALNNGKCRLVCGYSGEDKNPEAFNGIGCLAAYLVAFLKVGNPPKGQNSITDTYLMVPDAYDCGEEYTYTISESKLAQNGPGFRTPGEILLKVVKVGQTRILYEGPLSKFDPAKAESEK